MISPAHTKGYKFNLSAYVTNTNNQNNDCKGFFFFLFFVSHGSSEAFMRTGSLFALELVFSPLAENGFCEEINAFAAFLHKC